MGKAERTAEGGPLDLSDLPLWLVHRGMLGLPLQEQFAGFCQYLVDAGFPARRSSMGMTTLHPRYGSVTFDWRPQTGKAEYRPFDRADLQGDVYLSSPIHFMLSRGLATMRCRLDRPSELAFALFDELRADGLTDYAVAIIRFERERTQDYVPDNAGSHIPPPVAGVYFSCATDLVDGFQPEQLQQVEACLPYLALAVKSRLTFDVATTVMETYLGRDAGQRVLTGQIERGAVRSIDAVIWQSDLRGFTHLADTLPRDLLLATLNDYLEFMTRPVQKNQGEILKFMGDGVLAIFDLTGRDPVAVTADAMRAADDLRRALPAFNLAREQAGKPVMEFGLALHAGEVSYGNIGAEERLDFTVVGPAVNEASRIQALCRPLERPILISRTFRDLAQAQPEVVQSLGFHALRGVREPQELFTLAEH